MLELFNRSPWQRSPVVSLQGSVLAQAEKVCEPTAEGGLRCEDGTYQLPGCEKGSPAVIQGQPLVKDFPVIPVALAVAGVSVAGLFLLSGRRMGAGTEETLSMIQELATSIMAERAADAWNHQQYVARRKESQELLEKERQAELALEQETRSWEEMHRNPDELQAAQNAMNDVIFKRTELKSQADDYLAKVQANAQNVLAIRQKALNLILDLPEEAQADARRLIDPCYQTATAMKGVNRYPVTNLRG